MPTDPHADTDASSPHGSATGSFEWLVLVGLAVASFVGINFYEYPSSNHNISVPFIVDLLDPSRYPGDPLIAERAHFYTVYDDLLASLVRITGLEIATVFHLLFGIALIATFAAFFKLAIKLTRRRDAALFASMLFLFGVGCLGGVRTIEGSLMERSLALPIELWAIAALLDGRIRTALAAVGIAFLIHPLSGAYCFAALVLAGAVSREVSWSRLFTGIAIFVALSLPVSLGRFFGDGPKLPFSADPEWLDLLMKRSASHLDVSSWPMSRWIGSAGFVGGFFWLAKGLEGEHRRRVLALGAAVVAICTAGFVFVELVPVSLAVQMQLFRSFRFLVYLGLILFASQVLDGRGTRSRILAAGVLVGFFYGSAGFGYVVPGTAVTILLWWPVRTLIRDRNPSWHRAAVAACVVAAGTVGFLWNGFWVGNAAAPAWVKVQAWARDNTPADAGFIVPPDRYGFRIVSERTIYGDWKDGTQTFFNPEFGRGWLHRMRRLGSPPLDSDRFGDKDLLRLSYAGLDLAALRIIADEMTASSEVYVVTDGERPGLERPVVYRSSQYRVYRVR